MKMFLTLKNKEKFFYIISLQKINKINLKKYKSEICNP